MKLATPNKNRRIIIITTIIVVIMGAVGVSALYLLPKQPSTSTGKETINLNTPTKGEIKAGQNIKKNSIDNTNSNNDTQTIGVSLHGIQNSDQVIFDTVIQTVTNTGECTLVITSSGQTITKTSTIFANPSSSSCRGFAVSTSLLPKGTWTATLTVKVGTSVGTSSADISVD